MASYLCQIRYSNPAPIEPHAEQVSVIDRDLLTPEQTLALAQAKYRAQVSQTRKARPALDKCLKENEWTVDCIKL